MEANFSRCSPGFNIRFTSFSYLHELKSNVKLFADDTSFFTIVKDINESASILNNDLLLISKWAFNWKMLFNPDPTKLAQEVIFSKKKENSNSSNHKS